MKKFAKILSSALCAVLCIIVLAGCGGKAQLDTEASVSKKGLAASNMNEFTTFQETHEDVNTNLKSYRYTLKMNMSGFETYVNGIAQLDDNGKVVGTAAKGSSKYSEPTTGITVEAEQEIYVKDGVGYIYLKSNVLDKEYKCKITLPTEPAEPAEPSDGDEDSTLDSFASAAVELVELLEAFDFTEIENVTVTKYEKGDLIRFGFEFTEGTTTNKYYIEINNNAITGIEIEANRPADEATGQKASYYYTAISAFDGKIEYPSFKGYTEVTEDYLEALMDLI